MMYGYTVKIRIDINDSLEGFKATKPRYSLCCVALVHPCSVNVRFLCHA